MAHSTPLPGKPVPGIGRTFSSCHMALLAGSVRDFANRQVSDLGEQVGSLIAFQDLDLEVTSDAGDLWYLIDDRSQSYPG